MNSRLRWRVVATLVVTFGISIFAWYPLLADRYGLPNPGFIRRSGCGSGSTSRAASRW